MLEIHQDQITRYGGSLGIRDLELLKLSLGMPAVSFGGEYIHTNIYEMASAYLFHIEKNHQFIDGNKRVGAVSTLVFLALNSYDFIAPQEKFADFALSVAKGELDKADVAVFIRK